MKTIKLTNPRNNVVVTCQVADSFFSKFCGLMLRKEININSGLILSESSESIVNSSIHMFFMRFDITTLWLNKDLVVVSKTLAKKWHPAYFSKYPACHVVELHFAQLNNFEPGDKVIFEYTPVLSS